MAFPSSFSLKLMFVFSLSVTVAASSSSSSLLHSLKTIRASSSSPKSTASDLVSLLGSREEASRISAKEAKELRSCLKFIVPFSPPSSSDDDLKLEEVYGKRRELLDSEWRRCRGNCVSSWNRRIVDELVWWPPAPVLELARLAVDSAGDPAAIHSTLDPTVLPVPDVEGSKEDHCELTRTPYGWRFISEELNSYVAFLFEVIASRGPAVGLNISLNRFDFFHGHAFLAWGSGRLGILFHAKEYPAYDKDVFPYNMGYCQIGSNVEYDASMNLRNILWLAPLPNNSTRAWLSPGVLVVLDAHPGGIIYKELVPDYVDFARTIYEDDFGELVFDVNYFNIGDKAADYKLFIC